MILKAFAVHDSKAGAYLRPFFEISKGSAIRAISDAVNTPDHQFNRHAADFTLFEIGGYDDATGDLTAVPHVNLGCLIEMLETPD
ncbi:nonstructural protein [Microviridae sp.]|nr:nonstructural protein [Microviridae sp.]